MSSGKRIPTSPPWLRTWKSGEDDLIYDAVVNLGELNNEAAIEPLLPFLSHPKRIIVLAAMQSLENLHAKEAVESIASIFTDLWFFPIPPYKMTLDQIEKSRTQCMNDWADRCKVILAIGAAWCDRLACTFTGEGI